MSVKEMKAVPCRLSGVLLENFPSAYKVLNLRNIVKWSRMSCCILSSKTSNNMGVGAEIQLHI